MNTFDKVFLLILLIIGFFISFVGVKTLWGQETVFWNKEANIAPYGVNLNTQTKNVFYYNNSKIPYSNTNEIEEWQAIQSEIQNEIIR